MSSNRISKFAALLGVISLGCLISGSAHARKSFDTIGFKPAGDFGHYFVVQGAETLGRWGFAVGLTTEFSNDSLVLRNAAGVRIRDVINHQLALDFAGALGVTDWLNVGLLATVVPIQDFNTAPGVSDNGFRMGDVRVDAKARILDNKKYPVGLAVIPFVTIPTGNSTHFIGNGKVTGGAVISVESKRLWDRFSVALNLGSQFRNEVTLSPGTTIDSQFLYGLGLNYAVAKRAELVAELTGWTPWAHLFQSNSRNLEVNGGVRVMPNKNIALTVGGGTGLQDGAGAPSYRVFLMAAYRHPREEAALIPPPEAAAPEPVKEEVVRTNKIHFAFNQSKILASSFPVLDKIVELIKSRSEIEHVRVEGHTDGKGSDVYNQKLSERRANAVKDYLAAHGIESSKMSAEGKGKSEPIGDNATAAGRAQNRRVEFHLQLSPSAKVKIEKETDAPTYLEDEKAPAPRKRAKKKTP